MKKTVGYIIKEGCHTLNKALKVQFEGATRLYVNKEQALKDIDLFKKHNAIHKNARPKVFKVTVEEV